MKIYLMIFISFAPFLLLAEGAELSDSFFFNILNSVKENIIVHSSESNLALASSSPSNIPLNGSFESGAFSANASVVDANNAMTSAVWGDLPIDYYYTDVNVYWITDPSRATDGSRFMYLPEASATGKCIYQYETLYGGELTPCSTYDVTFDVAGFDENGTNSQTEYATEFFYTNSNGSSGYQITVQSNFTLEGTNTPAPNPIPTSSWNNLNWTRVTGRITLPEPNSTSYDRMEFVLSGNSGGGILIDNVCIQKVSDEVSFTSELSAPTCNSTTANNNGNIRIVGGNIGDRYEYNTTGFDGLPLTYAGAGNTISSLPQTVINNIPNTNPTTDYFLRVYDSGGCFKDTTIVYQNMCSTSPCCNSADVYTCSAGLLLNPEFESGLTSWDVSGTTIITSDSYFGTNAVANAGGSGGVQQAIAGTPGTAYFFSLYAKRSGTVGATVGVEFFDSSWNYLSGYHIDVTSTSWELYENAMIAPANTAYVMYHGRSNSGSGTAFFDGFCTDEWTLSSPSCSGASCDLSPHNNQEIMIFDASGDNSNNLSYDNYDLTLCDNGDGTLGLKGNIYRGNDADYDGVPAESCGFRDAWYVDLTLFDMQSWDEFQGPYVQSAGCGANHVDWDYWNLTGTFSGLGCNTGTDIDIVQHINGYRLQIGTGGNSNSCNFGMSTWFLGTENGAGSISGDIYAHIDENCYMSLRPSASGCENMITNQEFDNGTTDWSLYNNSGSTSSLSVNNNSILSGTSSGKVAISNVSGTDWHIQLSQSGKSIEAGKTYEIGFYAKASGSRDITVATQHQQSPWTTYSYQSFAITTTPTYYSYEFTASTTAENLVSLYFGLGESTKNVFIDDVSFREVCSDVNIISTTVSSCIDQDFLDVATVDIEASWTTPASSDIIWMSYGDKIEYFDISGVSPPQTVQIVTPADGSSGNIISVGFSGQAASASTAFTAPAACSSEEIECDILYLCGSDKPDDGDPYDHGFIEYLNLINGTNTITPAYWQADGSGYGLYDPNNIGTSLNINLNDYGLVVISPTVGSAYATDLVDDLKTYSGGILNMLRLLSNDFGMASGDGWVNYQDDAYIDNQNQVTIYNYDNIDPTYDEIVSIYGYYSSNADAYLWDAQWNASGGNNGIFFHYTPDDVLPGISSHGNRVQLGYFMEGLYSNAANGGALPAPSSSYFDPVIHLTLEGKSYLDQAIALATAACGSEICGNGVDDNGDGQIDENCCNSFELDVLTTSSTACPGETVTLSTQTTPCTVNSNNCNTNLISSFPYFESFENTFGDWTHDNTDDFDWINRANTTPSGATGPSSAADGSRFVYVEASNPNYPSKTTILNSPCFDLSSAAGAEMTFKYHMYGIDMGSFDVQISTDNGANWNSLFLVNTNQGETWKDAVIDLDNYVGQKVNLRFYGTTGSGYRGDIVVDAVSLTTTDYNYVWSNGATTATVDVSFSNTTTYTVTVTDNSGNSEIGSVDVSLANNCGEICDNGIDDDNDGLIDCNDPDCSNGLDVNLSFTDLTICDGENTTITASATGGDGTYTYSWNNSLGSGTSHTVSPTSNTIYTVTVTSGTGCTDVENVTIIVNPNPVIAPWVNINDGTWLNQNNVSVCIGGSFKLGTQTGLQSGIVLTLPNGSTDNSPSGDAYFELTNHVPSQAGNYTITYTDANGCIDTQSYVVTTAACTEVCDNGYDDDLDGQTDCDDSDCSDSITADISAFPTGTQGYLCNATDYTFTATDAGVGMTYNWDFGIYATPQNPTGKGPHTIQFSVPTSNVSTNITAQLTVSNSYSCSKSDSETLTIRPMPEIASVSVTNNSNCVAQNGQIQATVNVPSGADFEISLDGGTTWETTNDTNFNGLDGGNYALVIRYAGGSCENDYADVTVGSTAMPIVVADDINVGCPGVYFEGNVLDNDSNYGTVSVTITAQPGNGNVIINNAGDFSYTPSAAVCSDEVFTYQVCDDATQCCASNTATLRFADNTAPVLLNVPPADTVFCDEVVPQAPFVFAYENCPSINLGLEETSTQGDDGCSLHDYTLTRTWTATDACGNSGTATQEVEIMDITAPDIFRIYTLPNGKKMVAGVIENVTQRWKTVQLPIDFATTPLIFSQVITINQNSAVTVRTRNVASSQFEIKLQEEQANDNIHGSESVSWIAVEEGMSAGEWEVMTASIDDSFTTVNFNQDYGSAPVVLTSMQSTFDSDPAAVRWQNATSNSIQLQIEEEQSTESDITHSNETTAVFAITQSDDLFRNIDDEVFGESGKVSTSHAWATVNFQYAYHNPVLIANSLAHNGANESIVRVRNLTSSGFEVQVQEWDYLDGAHASEVIGWFVVEGSLPLTNRALCDEIPAALTMGTEIVTVDNCDINVVLNFTEVDNDTDCSNRTIVRTYSAADECGNTTTFSQTLQISDDEGPTFTAPSDAYILCTEDKDDLVLTGDVTDEMDNCAENLEAVYTDNLSNMNAETCATGYVTRTWTLSDDCGNSTSQTQIINIFDNTDRDGDGSPDLYDLDRDNDGIPNSDELAFGMDNDGDGITNDKDTDSDNDGITDAIEARFIDLQGDGAVDNVLYEGWDSDGDGFAEGFDADDNDTSSIASDNFDPLSYLQDVDGDGVPNFLDLDSDNDGIPDLIEVMGVDVNGDGICDYPIPGDPTSMIDADGDGYNDLYDSDDDGINGQDDASDPLVLYNGNIYTAGRPGDVLDSDLDGVPNYLDTDSDNDGIPDIIEAGGINENGDGKVEIGIEFADDNADGLHDNYTLFPLIKTESDGATIDGRPEDMDANGTVYYLNDVDSDNIPNYLDLDSDGDGISDLAEIGGLIHDVNQDGIFDIFTDIDNDGFSDVAKALLLVTTEPDGVLNNGRPADGPDTGNSPYRTSHADGTLGDANGEADVDIDGDGLLNFLDTDSDADNILDAVEDANADGLRQVQETSAYDRDTDNDLIIDGIEDANQDGIYTLDETDPTVPDTDGDTLNDGVEDSDQNGLVNGDESDPRDPCDPILSPACVGIAVRPMMKLQGAMSNNGGGGWMRDDLRVAGFIPTTEPYSEMDNFIHVGEGGGETIDPIVFDVIGGNAIVDWVFVEVRDSANAEVVISSRAALLQRDGDVRDVDGVSDLFFADIPAGYYHISVRHRNHLGLQTRTPKLLTRTVTEVDFINVSDEVYGVNPASISQGEYHMWAGDMNQDRKVIYQGPNNDLLDVFIDIVTHPDNVNFYYNYVLPGYHTTDLNMDGKVIYQGPGNEPSKLLFEGILLSPENSNFLSNFIISEKIED